MGEELKLGNEYRVVHSRKGEFLMRVDEIDETWVRGVITSGSARRISNLAGQQRHRYEGDAITVRRSFCTFTPAAPGEE